jgi:hypothetical protein
MRFLRVKAAGTSDEDMADGSMVATPPSRATDAPRPRSRSTVSPISPISGRFSRTTGPSSARRDATRVLLAAFFAPGISISPRRTAPPARR